MIRRRLIVHGHVQGVGFRWAIARAAESRGVAGWVTNRADGTVEAVLEGEPEAVEVVPADLEGRPAGRARRPRRRGRGGAGGPERLRGTLMAKHVVLLRGINIGPRNRIAMPALREALEEAGFTEVQTYLQSGNVVLESRTKPEAVRRKVEQLVEEALRPRDRGRRAGAGRARRGREAQPARQGRDRPEGLPGHVSREEAPRRRSCASSKRPPPKGRAGRRGREVYAWHPKTIARSQPCRSSPARASASPPRRATGRRSRPCSSSPAARPRPAAGRSFPRGAWASAFGFSASNSGWVMAPLSSSCFACSISAAGPPESETERM